MAEPWKIQARSGALLLTLAICCVVDGRSVKDASAISETTPARPELLALIDPLDASDPRSWGFAAQTKPIVTRGSALAVAPFAAPGLRDHGYSCNTTCNGKPFDSDASESSCWGKLHWFCKSTNRSIHAYLGVTCEGHYMFYADKDAGKVVATCEGLIRYFNVRTATCPASGKTWTRFVCAGCLGTGVSSMSTSAPIGPTAATAEWDAGRVTSGAGHVFESRCSGMGGEVKGVKAAAAAAGGAPGKSYDDVEEMAADVDAALTDLGIPSELVTFGTPAPVDHGPHEKVPRADLRPEVPEVPDNSLVGMLLPAVNSKVDLGDGRSVSCNLTCNGAVPWLHGALPCWGELKLHCGGHRDDDGNDDDEGSDDVGGDDNGEMMKRAAGSTAGHIRKVLAEDEGSVLSRGRQEGQRVVEMQAVRMAELSGSGSSFEFEAVCKGLWTGWLGKRCYGLVETHGLFVSAGRDVESWIICTGHAGVMGKKGKEGGGYMGRWCRGHADESASVKPHVHPSQYTA